MGTLGTALPKLPLSVAALCVVLMMSGPQICSAGKGTGKFWHITDIHYDHVYPTSCMANTSTKNIFGDDWCDSPWALVEASLKAMSTYHSDVDFLLWSGDTVAHIKEKDLSVDTNLGVLRKVTDAIKAEFPNKAVYATFGNHDYYPKNQFPSESNAIYKGTAEMWKDWIGEDQLANFRKGGYYTSKTPHGLRIVALNTNLYHKLDKATTNLEDPTGQLQWLKTVLQAAKTAGEKVLVTAHVPPGSATPSDGFWYHDRFNNPVNNALKEFADIIVGMHFGHNHYDGFKIITNKQGKPAAPLFVAPSLSPWRSDTGPRHNPSIRLVSYDRDTGKQLTYEQLTLDLAKANAAGKADFTLLYNFAKHYKVSDISASSLDSLVTRMESATGGDKSLLQDYYRFTAGGAEKGMRKCTTLCLDNLLCGFSRHIPTEFDDCVIKLYDL